MEKVPGHSAGYSESNKIIMFLTERRGSMNRRFLRALGVVGIAFLSLACSGIPDNVYVSAWAAKITDKLKDPNRLTPEEQHYPSLRVVAAGESLAEQIAMRKSGTPVNVRNYPATELDNGNDTKIVGTIPLGSEISNVVFTKGIQPNSPLPGLWGAFDCSNAPDMKLKPGISLKAGTICTVYGDYLVRPDGSADYGKGIIGPSTADQQAVNH